MCQKKLSWLFATTVVALSMFAYLLNPVTAQESQQSTASFSQVVNEGLTNSS